MARISTYPRVFLPEPTDTLVLTDASDDNITKLISIDHLRNYMVYEIGLNGIQIDVTELMTQDVLNIISDKADISSLNQVQTSVNNNLANITSNASSITTVTAAVNNNLANISLNQSAIVTETSARVQSINTLTASVGEANALIETNRLAVATETSARVSQSTTLKASIDGNYAGITTNQTAIANVDGTVDALYSLDVTANGNVAGMKLGANNDGSFVSFLADSFKIYNGDTAYSPFEVVDGIVKIKSAAIGSITLGNISDAPDGFSQVTTVYASDINGTGASTTKGTKNFVAWYTGLDIWTPAIGISGLTFQQITGVTGAQGPSGADGADGADAYIPVKGVDYFDGVDGQDGADGDSAYSAWLAAGNTGDTTDFLNSLVGQDGANGSDGIPGEPGADGVTTYTWIRYADSGDGSQGFSNSPVDKQYIGFAFNKTTNVESNNRSDYTWSLIKGADGADGADGTNGTNGTNGANGTNGTNGLKTKTGLVWYSANSASNPGQPSATRYNFTNNTITGLSSSWSLSPPIMQPGTASNLYWTSTYNVTEQASPANTGTITFEATTQAFGFDQVVTFNSLSTNSSTVINGENITTGIIQSSNYVAPAYNNLGFSTQGMGIDLNDGSIHSEQFYVNANGSAGFSGAINLSSPATANRGVQTINLAPSAAEISLSHASILVNGAFPSGTGASKLSSEGLYIDNAGTNIQNIETETGGDGNRNGITACQFEGKARLMVPTSTYPYGKFITGLFATAYNKADDDVNRNTSVRRAEAYGAVIENLRADGLAERLHNIPSSASSPYRLPDLYAHYIHFSSSATVLRLPSNPKTGQVVKVTRIGSATPTVASTQTDFSNSGGTSKIRVQNGWDADIQVSKTEEFIFQGFFWIRVNHD